MAARADGSDGKYSVVVLPGTYKVEIIGSTVYAHGWYSLTGFTYDLSKAAQIVVGPSGCVWSELRGALVRCMSRAESLTPIPLPIASVNVGLCAGSTCYGSTTDGRAEPTRSLRYRAATHSNSVRTMWMATTEPPASRKTRRPRVDSRHKNVDATGFDVSIPVLYQSQYGVQTGQRWRRLRIVRHGTRTWRHRSRSRPRF